MKTGANWLGKARQAIGGEARAGGIAQHVTLSFLALAVLLVISAGIITFVSLYSALRQNIENELDIDSRLLQLQLHAELNSIAHHLAVLSSSPRLLRNISDATTGRNSLVSMLTEYVPPTPQPLTLVVFDGAGRPLAANMGGDLQAYDGNTEVRRVLDGGAAQATAWAGADGRRILQLAYPVPRGPGERSAGALLGSVDLDGVFDDAVILLNENTSLHEFTLEGMHAGPVWADRSGYLQQTVALPLAAPMDRLGLQVRIGQKSSAVFAPLRRSALIYAGFAALTLMLALYLARRIARQLSSPLAALSSTASEIATSGSFDIKADVRGDHEVASLAQAFNKMLDRLAYAYSQLHLRNSEFKALVENSPDLIARFDRELRCIYINRMVQAYFGVPAERVIRRTAPALGIRKSVQQIMTRLLREGGEQVYDYHPDGRHFEARFVAEHDNGGGVVSILCIMRDVTARRTAEETLRLANRAIESSDSPIVVTACEEPDYPVLYVNPAFERLTGYSAEEVIGRSCRFLQGEDREQPELELLRSALRERREVNVVLRNYRKDGSRFWNELSISPIRGTAGEVTHFVGELTDITARHEQQEQLHYQATHDPLTGLPNRNLLIDRLRQAISYAQRYQRMIAVAFLDLDKFKWINDTLGHDAGDQVLKIVADRLTGCMRDSDTVARLGGDEFVLVLFDQANEDITYHAMQRVLTSISQPMTLAGSEMTITCSIGFAVYPQDGRDAETLIKNADTAMYRAKELGRDNFQFYTDDLNARISERLAMETGLRRALDMEEFVLHYLPRVELASGTVTGMEALIRWNHPQLGLVEPRRFMPLAEELGLMHRIGEWVIRDACRQQKAWQRDGVADLPVSVNISSSQFLQRNFTQLVAALLREAGVEASRLELEITELLSMHDPETTIRVLRELRQLGVRVAIDDFGTGYMNLSYMKQFPLTGIKLDGSFVRDMVRNPDDLAISDAVISMAHSLHLKVTAEGVESATQLALLADHGCDEMQGFYFSAAMPVEQCTALLQENRVLPADKLGRHRVSRTLLLIDDEPHVLTALERILRRTGCRILTAPSAIDAFDLMATHEIGVILSDQRMPEMTGVEFFARIRYMYPATVRMILSGYADIDAVTNAINIGAVYKFLNKPWDADELCTIVTEAFDKYESDLQYLSRSAQRLALAC